LDKPKGTKTSKYGIERKKDYWKLAVYPFRDCQDLLRRLPLRHPEKISKKQLALAPSSKDSWSWVGPKVEEIRRNIRAERDDFLREAEKTYLATHEGDREMKESIIGTGLPD
jgi:hypothetical protein